ncbi:hypothetical protein [Halobacterium sp. CBA1126]|uniref:hypothetical protein n=1 Tax=Halobacterium sp. CBA1126 TaxID=2668074 RepID=UPI001E4DEFEC|nr:hypothetical protein [Halobacterium sp. CBA1126]
MVPEQPDLANMNFGLNLNRLLGNRLLALAGDDVVLAGRIRRPDVERELLDASGDRALCEQFAVRLNEIDPVDVSISTEVDDNCGASTATCSSGPPSASDPWLGDESWERQPVRLARAAPATVWRAVRRSNAGLLLDMGYWKRVSTPSSRSRRVPA